MSKRVIEDLYQRFGHLPGITIELHKELVAINAVNQSGSATVFLQGAQIAQYQANGESPLLFLSDDCTFQQNTPLRGGIPICWPWFNGLHNNPPALLSQLTAQGVSEAAIKQAPAHGLVRDQPWSLDNVDTQSHETRLTLSLNIAADQFPCWPFAAELSLTIIIGDALSVSLAMTNRHDRPLLITGALHTYLAVSNIDAVQVHGLDELMYVDALANHQPKQQVGAVTVSEEVDRMYQQVNDLIVLDDQGMNRQIALRQSGCHSMVVWNPWIEKGARLSQFKDDDYQRMLCLESANVINDILEVAPNDTHCMQVQIR